VGEKKYAYIAIQNDLIRRDRDIAKILAMMFVSSLAFAKDHAMRAPLTFLLFLLTTPSLAEISQAQKDEIASMHWINTKEVHLKDSKSDIGDLQDYRVVTGAEARRFRDIIDVSADSHQEADAVDFNTGSELVYSWIPEGYISSNDWSDVDADNFLSQIQANDAETNKIRRQRGLPIFTTIGWKQKPTLNQDLHTVSWAIQGRDSNGDDIINVVALKLGRYGVEKIVWIINPSEIGNRNDLLRAINAHKYDDGARYTDYVAGTDHEAAYGVAGLVAGALGVKLLKVAGAGAALVALKKFGILLLLPFVYAWRKLAGSFKKKSKPTASG
jgi:hypothetical protein